jgi:hypothetical protein
VKSEREREKRDERMRRYLSRAHHRKKTQKTQGEGGKKRN